MGDYRTSDHVMLDPKSPYHKAGAKEGFWAGLIVAICGIIFWTSVDVGWMSLFWKSFLTIVMSGAAGFGVWRWFSGLYLKTALRKGEEARELRERETQRQLEEMRRRKAMEQ